MALEGLLAKLGPTLVREATPHLVQVLAGFGERFRKDTRDIKSAVESELAAIARSHANLSSAVERQGGQLEALQAQLTVTDRKVELLHKSLETLMRQLASDAAEAASMQRSTRRFALLAALFSALFFAAAVALLVLHR